MSVSKEQFEQWCKNYSDKGCRLFVLMDERSGWCILRATKFFQRNPPMYYQFDLFPLTCADTETAEERQRRVDTELTKYQRWLTDWMNRTDPLHKQQENTMPHHGTVDKDQFEKECAEFRKAGYDLSIVHDKHAGKIVLRGVYVTRNGKAYKRFDLCSTVILDGETSEDRDRWVFMTHNRYEEWLASWICENSVEDKHAEPEPEPVTIDCAADFTKFSKLLADKCSELADINYRRNKLIAEARELHTKLTNFFVLVTK